jgi:S1-C subfamily serine protease
MIGRVMSETYTIDPTLHPDPGSCAFDLDAALSSVVSVHTKVPDNAYTVQALGDERAGHGVVISDTGLVVTIGYLIVEAEQIWMTDHTGQVVPGHVVGYDQETGFGLVQALGRLNAPAMPLGSARDLHVGDPVILAGHGGTKGAVSAVIADKREFAGYWEYLLDEALFTEPPHPFWGGAALIDTDGRLCGIGSLFVQKNPGELDSFDGNMIVPIDILMPILDDLQRFGAAQHPPRPWIGALSAEADDRVIIVNTWDGGPADEAGIEAGDMVVGVGGEPVASLAQFYRRMWALGAAGVDVPLNIVRDGRLAEVSITSADRSAFYLAPKLH